MIVPVSGIHRGVLRALQYAKTIAPDHVTALYINVDDEATQKLREKWGTWVNGIELVVIASPYRSLVGPLSRFVDRRVKAHPDQMVTVVLPEFVPARWWHHLLHNQEFTHAQRRSALQAKRDRDQRAISFEDGVGREEWQRKQAFVVQIGSLVH